MYENDALTGSLSNGTLTIGGTGRIPICWGTKFFPFTQIVIGAGVTKVNEAGVGGTPSVIGHLYLTSIEVENTNPLYASENGVLFNKEKTKLLLCPRGKSGSYTIPNSVECIDGEAFQHCNNLTSIIIPNSVKVIYKFAFARCNGLTSIIIPNGVEHIYRNSFSYCTNLSSVITSSSIKSIDLGAFYGCPSLTSITIQNPVPIKIYKSFEKKTYVLKVPTESVECYRRKYAWMESVRFESIERAL